MHPQFPALYLYSLNDSFAVKHILLLNGQRTKIGRQTNAKTVPAERNGYFDSKVLSRQHAEVWEEGNKIFIKDVKSSNGTFINGERLSPEGLESDPYELKSDDIVEFGIDIVGEDNKTIIHHKVAARVVCVFSETDVQVASRAEQHQASHPSSSSLSLQPSPGSSSSSGGGSSFNFQGQRRPPLQPQGLGGMGGMGGSMRAPGKNGLTFDHILSRLQGELQKSRETGAELHSLTGAMSDIHDTLGGALPPTLPPYPQSLPPVRPLQSQQEPTSATSPSDPSAPPRPTPDLAELQSQLHETQSSLADHVDKIRALEGVLAEHEAIKREVGALRGLVEGERRRAGEERMEDVDGLRHGLDEVELDDEDDKRSIRTIIPRELESVEEEDEDQLAAAAAEEDEEEEGEEERRRRREELGRPRTPEPTSLGMDSSYTNNGSRQSPSNLRCRSPSPSHTVIDELTQRLTRLSDQLESALELSSSLQAQHTKAQSTIMVLEEKVGKLEEMVKASSLSSAPSLAPPTSSPTSSTSNEQETESLTQLLTTFQKSVQGQWSSVQLEWKEEREKLSKAREEFESKMKVLEGGLAKVASMQHQHMGNGDVVKASGGGGLVTPPSPRSLSSDSNGGSDGGRRRRRRSGSRGRGRSRSQSTSTTAVSVADPDMFPIQARRRRPYSPDEGTSDNEDEERIGEEEEMKRRLIKVKTEELGEKDPTKDFPTPESSVHHQPSGTNSASSTLLSSSVSSVIQASKEEFTDAHLRNVSAAVGVIVLGVAAAAVIWRVKPE